MRCAKEEKTLQPAYSLLFAYYDSCRTHKSLQVAPAMEGGLIDHVWTIQELVVEMNRQSPQNVYRFRSGIFYSVEFCYDDYPKEDHHARARNSRL
jgi:hypothetical protein